MEDAELRRSLARITEVLTQILGQLKKNAGEATASISGNSAERQRLESNREGMRLLLEDLGVCRIKEP